MQLVKIPNDISTTIDNTALFTIKYLRCGSKGGRVSFTFVSDVIGIQRALIDWSVAVAVFRRSKLRFMSGELLVTSRQLRQIGFNVTVEQLVEKPKSTERFIKLPRIQEIGYCVDIRRGNYIVTLPKNRVSRRQQRVLSPSAFLHVFPGTDRRSAGGTQFASLAQLELLGFRITPVKTVVKDNVLAIIA